MARALLYQMPGDLETMKKSRKDSRGFTILELGVALAVVVILTSVMVPNAMQAARISQAETFAEKMVGLGQAATLYYQSNPTWPQNQNALVDADLISAVLVDPFAEDVVSLVENDAEVLVVKAYNIPDEMSSIFAGQYGRLPLGQCDTGTNPGTMDCWFNVLPPSSI